MRRACSASFASCSASCASLRCRSCSRSRSSSASWSSRTFMLAQGSGQASGEAAVSAAASAAVGPSEASPVVVLDSPASGLAVAIGKVKEATTSASPKQRETVPRKRPACLCAR
eukprot:5148052-Pleurochrysis_carterae.AAC.1